MIGFDDYIDSNNNLYLKPNKNGVIFFFTKKEVKKLYLFAIRIIIAFLILNIIFLFFKTYLFYLVITNIICFIIVLIFLILRVRKKIKVDRE